jgi:hypothetical protein
VRRWLAALMTVLLALLGLALTNQSAPAAIRLPGAPVVSIGHGAKLLDDSTDLPITMSPRPGERGFSIVHYDYVLPNTPDFVPSPNELTQSNGQLTLNIGSGPAMTPYIIARMVVSYGSWTYTTGWSKAIPIKDPGMSKPPTCPGIQFVGVRGSGETNMDGWGFGNTVAAVKWGLQKNMADVNPVGIDYQAVPVQLSKLRYASDYLSSVSKGIDVLSAYLKSFFASPCGQVSYLVIAGYSQGAQVAGDAYAHLKASQRSRVAGLVLFGDPMFSPFDFSFDAGSYSMFLRGSYPGPALRFGLFAATQNIHSYCTSGDPVCNLSPLNLKGCIIIAACPHLFYVERGWTNDAVRWVWQHYVQVSGRK